MVVAVILTVGFCVFTSSLSLGLVSKSSGPVEDLDQVPNVCLAKS